ncbi:uncharacterized protein EMPS_01332 [Entomortierella parvispora]|uniref:Ankyrin n=1 Tax=Entomortierella parvispora TaxID=205924 RepID=A0A9P3H2L9_9FUNG|nr:uncharacterized protein EMPS_01332 [Entomortierella parvispora]
MAALRAMLQLRSNSQPSALLPSQQPTYHSHNHHSHHSRRQKYQPEAPSSTSSSIHKNNSNSNTSSTMTVTYKNSHNTNSSNNSSVSSVHSVSTGSLHHGHSAFGAAAAAVVAATQHHHHSPTQKSPSSSKKQAPFQNLGLHSGAALGNLGLVKFALDNGQPIDSVVNGVSAIHAACCSNANVAVVLFLIERGADVNARRLPRKHSNEKGVQTVGTTGSTPLHFAAANGCLTVVDILLRHGAIVDMTDKYGSSPLSVAAARNHPEVASLLRQYSAMQRGVQDLTPELETKDPIAERRVSADRSSRSSHERDSRSQSPLQSATRPLPPSTTTRVPGQRRISLPSIVEGPSSPNMSAPPRQSCDFGRLPHSTEPLAKSATFIRSTPSVPTRNYSKSTATSPFKPEDRSSGSKSPLPTSATRTKKGSPGRTSMQRSHTSHGTYLTAPEPHSSVKRRRSMDFLSPQPASASTVNRRKSFDQLSAMTNKDPKTRRSSDASTDSQGTASSGTAGSLRTVDTAASDPPSENSFEEHDGAKYAQVHSMSRPIDSGTASINPSPLTRSVSQPVLENLRPYRPVTFATEPAVRQSLDIQMLMSNQQRQERQSMDIPRNDSDPDLSQQLYRRRTMQENGQPKMVTIPRNLSIGPTIEVLAASGSEESVPRHRTSTSSSVSLQEAAPRHSTGSYSSTQSNLSFSGSATVSGRLSRMWSSSGKENGPSAGNWNVGEFAEASGEAAAQGLVRSKSSMLNRLSGIWSRR